MLTFLCVLKSGAEYTPEYVEKLHNGVKRFYQKPYKFICLSDVPVSCETIPIEQDWPGWWCKIEMFKPGVITGPTLYLDLDTVIVGNLDKVSEIPVDFAMLDIKSKGDKVGNSGAMWFTKPQTHVYEKFLNSPEDWIDFHKKNAKNRYMGDQAFISDCFQEIPKLHHFLPGLFVSYKYDNCQHAFPKNSSIVCFGGRPRPHEANGWVREYWK